MKFPYRQSFPLGGVIRQDDSGGEVSDVYLETLLSNRDQESKYPNGDL